jgi:hypothetical protein
MVEDLSRSLACCGLGAVPLQAGGDGLARVVLRHAERRATFAGATRCASPWACPVCAPSLNDKRVPAIRPQVARLMDAGWTAHIAALTVQHGRKDALADLFGIIGKAWGGVTSGRAWKDAGAEFIKGYDYTRTRANGHHLHLHVLLLLPPEHGDGEAFTHWFRQRWMQKVREAGGEALPGAQKVERADNPEAAAAYALTPAACYEVTGMVRKRARAQAESGKERGETPFEILARAVAGDRQAAAWWREYVAATKGKKQVTTSAGLSLSGDKELLAEAEGEVEVEGEVEGERKPDADALAAMTPRGLRTADRAGLLPKALDAAEACAGDADAARAAVALLLAVLPAEDWWILPPSGAPPEDVTAAKAADEETERAQLRRLLARVPAREWVALPSMATSRGFPEPPAPG